ncbi:MAG: hypothetical protein R6V19_11250 [Armatimonadota bacterium]
MATAFIKISHRSPVPRNYSCEDAGWEDARRIVKNPEQNEAEDRGVGDRCESADFHGAEEDSVSLSA